MVEDFLRDKKDFVAEEKADKTIVTEIDIKLNDFLGRFFADLGIPYIGEESEHKLDAIKTGTYVTVDPIDGTSNFVKMFNGDIEAPAIDNVTLISYVKDGIPVIGVCINHFTGELDIAVNQGDIKFESHITLEGLQGLDYLGQTGADRIKELKSRKVLVMGSKAKDPVNKKLSEKAPAAKIGGLGFRIISLCNTSVKDGIVYHKSQRSGVWDLAAPYVFASLNGVEIFDGTGNALDFTKDAYFPGNGAIAVKGDGLGFSAEIKDPSLRTMEALAEKAPEIKAVAFDIGDTLAVKTKDDPEGETPGDEVISAIVKLIKSGRNVAVISGKSIEAVKPWVEGKLASSLLPGERKLFKAYCDRMTKIFTLSETGELKEESRMQFPASIDKAAVLKVAEAVATRLNAALLEDESISDAVKELIKANPLKVKAGDEYVQLASKVNIDIKGDKTAGTARQIIKREWEKALKEAGLMPEDLMVILDGKKGAYARNIRAEKPGAIEHWEKSLKIMADNIVYVADQFAGKSVADLKVAETGVYCLNVGDTPQEGFVNVHNSSVFGPEGTVKFIEQIHKKLGVNLVADKQVSKDATVYENTRNEGSGGKYKQYLEEEKAIMNVSNLSAKEEEAVRKCAEAGLKNGTNALTPIQTHLRAKEFSANLMNILTRNPEETVVLAIDADLGEGQETPIMQIYKALDEISQMVPNLKLIRRSAKSGQDNLASEIKKLAKDSENPVKLENIFMVVRDNNLDLFEAFKGKSWITAINVPESRGAMEGAYMPVFEAAIMSFMLALGSDSEAIMRVYNSIGFDPATSKDITRDAIETMINSRTISLLPRIQKVSVEDLDKIYERVRKIFIAA
jgi:3'-phosphoadenosine 5'-phosphosulfate (PAPS) 3'-phosphatase/ribosomal protein S24E